LGIGDWGLGIGPNPQSPIPNPQSPIPNPHFNFTLFKDLLKIKMEDKSDKSKHLTLSLQKLIFYHSSPKNLNHKKNIFNDSALLLKKNKNTSIQLQSDINNIYVSNNSKISKKTNDETKISQKYFIKKGIPVKYLSTLSKNNSQFASSSRNSQSKMISFKSSKMNSEFVQNFTKILTPTPTLKRTRKTKLEQNSTLNLTRNKLIKQKKNYSFQNNINSIVETLK
jgi:hypothetical protein